LHSLTSTSIYYSVYSWYALGGQHHGLCISGCLPLS